MKLKTIYRIEKPISENGLWYNHQGEYDPTIFDLCPNAIAKDFPMGYNKDHSKRNKKWYSAGKSIENMHYWFSRSDAENLVRNGFRLYKFVVKEFQEKEFEVLFTREGVIRQEEIPIDDVWEPERE